MFDQDEGRELTAAAIRQVLRECCPSALLPGLLEHADRHALLDDAHQDAAAFARKDPASSHDIRNIIQAVTSYQAVLHYRIAHWLLRVLGHEDGGVDPRDAHFYALLVSKRGKLLSGADIHPKCVIGKRFILDHGYGNVIGETAIIGDDCYCNGGVILGSARIFGNTAAKRHPTLGDNVQIGGLVGIYGPITVGSDVFIGARCTITSDIPDGSRVVLKAELQITSGPGPTVVSHPLDTRKEHDLDYRHTGRC